MPGPPLRRTVAFFHACSLGHRAGPGIGMLMALDHHIHLGGVRRGRMKRLCSKYHRGRLRSGPCPQTQNCTEPALTDLVAQEQVLIVCLQPLHVVQVTHQPASACKLACL